MVEKVKKEVSLHNDLTGNAKAFGYVALVGFILTLFGLIVRHTLIVYKFQDIDKAGKFFEGVADFFGLAAFLGFGLMVLGLLSLALVGKGVHLYLRIGILIALGMIVGRFLSFGYFF